MDVVWLGVVLFIGMLMGAAVPDFDLTLRGSLLSGFIQHRSLLTHGLIVPIYLYFHTQRHCTDLWRAFTLGFVAVTAVHLSFDLFPRAWVGFALIYVPFWGRLGAWGSAVWLVAGVLASLIVGWRLTAVRWQRILFIVLIALAFAQQAAVERLWLWPLLTVGGLVWLAWRLTAEPIR